jgi:hypothetical protein
MDTFDTQLASGLHDIADGEPDSTPPTQRLLERGRRARHRRRAARAGTWLAVLASGTVAAVAIAATPAVHTDRPGVTAEAISPQMELAAAIGNSENISFKVKATTTLQKSNGTYTTPSGTYITQGAFDPATRTGYLRTADGSFQSRLINGVKYTSISNGDQFVQQKGTYDWLDYDAHVLDGALSGSADSRHLFKVLRQAQAKISKTSAGSYHFDATTQSVDSLASYTTRFVGNITLNASKRVAKVTYAWTLTGKMKQGGKVFNRNVKVTLEFSNYGTPVTVQHPASVVVDSK